MPYRKYLFIVLILLWGCSTKKNTWLSRNFHNTTAHYNVYFNGNESYKAGIRAIEDSYKDNYIKVLPMFEESDETAIGVATSSMDRAIDKGTKLIMHHSITAKPKNKSGGSKSQKDFRNRKEYNKWVDDALLMIGKAQIIKHDFRQAIRTLDLLIRDFSYEESKYSALIWKARAYTELKDFNNAYIALENYDFDGKAPENLYGKYMEVYANLLLVQEKYKQAIPILQNAIDGIDKRGDKARYSFILGQIKQLTGDEDGAANAYAQTLKNSPGYEMAFNAHIKRATIVYKNASIDEMKKQIKKMLRDKKNEEFRDQIYYALGKVYLNFDNEQEAIKNFEKSVEVSVNNDYQKTLSYLEIGDIYFNKEIYKPAYLHYDSAMMVISEDFKNYKLISERRNTLQLLVEQLDIINNQDSLIILADMSDEERDKFLEDIIETEKQKLKEEQKQKSRSGGESYFEEGSYQSMSPQAGGGKWYFYNVATKEMGKQEFIRRWGKRKLADNWRRNEKGIVEMSQDEPGEPGESGQPFSESTQQEDQNGKEQTSGATGDSQPGKIPTKESLLADIPLTPDAYQEALLTRDISIFEAGMIYLERLKNYPKAIEMFEACLSSSTIAEKDKENIYISLYKAYEANNNNVNKIRTLNSLKKHFPDSKFVQYLEDPDYLAKIETAKKLEDDEYANTYSNYLTGNYDMVIEKATNVELKDTTNIYLPKYRLIKALSYARKGDTELFKQNLETLTNKHSGTKEAELASLFLEQLDKGRTPVKSLQPYNSILAQRVKQMTKEEKKEQVDTEPDITGFLYTENEQHSFMALSPESANANRIIFNLADFNFSRYLINDYGIETTSLPDNSTAILIKGFKNKLEGMDYFYAAREHEDELFLSDSVKTKLFVISESNLKFFLSSGQINNYEAFFNTLYLKPVNIDDLPEEMLPKTEKEIAKPDIKETKQDTTVVDMPEVETAIKADSIISKQVTSKEPEKAVKETETSKQEVERKDSIPAPSPWVFNADSQQNIIVVFKKSRIDYNKILRIYTNFTKNTYKEDNLKVEINDFIEGYKYISVTGFKNKEQAKDYHNAIGKNAFLLRDVKNREHYIWIITQGNKTTLEKNKDLKGYDEFFKKEYR